MQFQVGDNVIAEAESATKAPRRGTVKEVLGGARVRYRIQWDDGHETIYSPAAGALKADASHTAA